MSAIASQITNLTIVHSTVYSDADKKKTSKLRVTGLCEGNSPVAGEFPTQRASNAEKVSIKFDDVIMAHYCVLLWFGTCWFTHILQGCFIYAQVAAKQPWSLWVNTSREFTKKWWYKHQKKNEIKLSTYLKKIPYSY